MKRLSQVLSVTGLLLLVAAVASFVSAGPDGLVLRWDRLFLYLGAALVSFVIAGRIGRS